MKIDRNRIAGLLTEKGAVHPCHRCGRTSFEILEGYSNLILQEDIGQGLLIGGPTVPVALVGCSNCGAITPHALGVLGLLPKKEEGKPNG